MGDKTGIEWAEATWNPVVGCLEVSEGCKRCYAARLAAGRLRRHPSRRGLAEFGADGQARWIGEVRYNWPALDQPARWQRSRRIFAGAHTDLFGAPPHVAENVFAVMALCRWHDFLVLTKRAEQMEKFVAGCDVRQLRDRTRTWGGYWLGGRGRPWNTFPLRWPLPNVWLGVSIENRERAGRLEALKRTPAAVRFVSFEPLLGPVGPVGLDGVDWAIAGGESGPGARPMEAEWAREIRDLCADAGVAFFFKQWGGAHAKSGGRELDGRTWDEFPEGKR